MEYKDYYQTLGVARDASQDQIKQAYRKVARKYHPDVSKEANAEAKFKAAGEAYEVLKDPEKRAAYDQFGANWRDGQNFEPPPNWDAGFEFRGAGYTGADASEFSDFFESLFGGDHSGGQGRRTFRMRGEDQHAKILISLADAYQGAQRTITLKRRSAARAGQSLLFRPGCCATHRGGRSGRGHRLCADPGGLRCGTARGRCGHCRGGGRLLRTARRRPGQR